jgi:hypothetical protein
MAAARAAVLPPTTITSQDSLPGAIASELVVLATQAPSIGSRTKDKPYFFKANSYQKLDKFYYSLKRAPNPVIVQKK